MISYVQLFSIVASVILLLGGYKLYFLVRDFIAAVRTLSEVSAKLADLKDIPKYAEGHARVAAGSLVQLEKLTKSVDILAKVVARPEEEPARLSVPEEADADKLDYINRLLNSRPEMERAKATQLAESALPTYEQSLSDSV